MQLFLDHKWVEVVAAGGADPADLAGPVKGGAVALEAAAPEVVNPADHGARRLSSKQADARN